MPYANVEDKARNSAARYKADPEYFKRKGQLHKEMFPALHALWGQRHTSKQRGVEFKLTFDEWFAWWGSDLPYRGRKPPQLQMCRYGDSGAYELGNIYKATQAENDAGPREKDEGLHEDIPY
jgi:hypothetical protein